MLSIIKYLKITTIDDLTNQLIINSITLGSKILIININDRL